MKPPNTDMAVTTDTAVASGVIVALGATVIVHRLTDRPVPPGVREVLQAWRNEDYFICPMCTPRCRQAVDAAIAAGAVLFDDQGYLLFEDEPDRTAAEVDRVVLGPFGRRYGICRRCAGFTDAEVIVEVIALIRTPFRDDWLDRLDPAF